jgi:hypothetical protein
VREPGFRHRPPSRSQRLSMRRGIPRDCGHSRLRAGRRTVESVPGSRVFGDRSTAAARAGEAPVSGGTSPRGRSPWRTASPAW